MTGSFRADYDWKGDVLYVSLGDPCPSESESHDRGVLLRYSFVNDTPSGVTVVGFRKNHWDREIHKLALLIAHHTGGLATAAERAVALAIGERK
jgi:hypothetical protein